VEVSALEQLKQQMILKESEEEFMRKHCSHIWDLKGVYTILNSETGDRCKAPGEVSVNKLCSSCLECWTGIPIEQQQEKQSATTFTFITGISKEE